MQISLQSFLTHCVNHPIMIRLFRASSGIAAVCVVAQVALFGWQMYEEWKLTDSGQNIMWHTQPVRDCIFWSVAGSIAWRIKTLCWSASLTFGKWLWSCFFPTRTTKLHKMQKSLSRRGIPCVTYHHDGKAELWAVSDESAWFDASGVYTKFTDKITNEERWYQRVVGGERGAQAITDFEPTPPASKKPTPIELSIEDITSDCPALEDQAKTLCIEDITSPQNANPLDDGVEDANANAD